MDDGTFNLFAIMGSIASILVLWFRFRQGRMVRLRFDDSQERRRSSRMWDTGAAEAEVAVS